MCSHEAPVKDILQNSSDRTVVLWSDHQERIGGGNLIREALHRCWPLRFEIRIVHRQIIDADEGRFDLLLKKANQGFCKLPVNRLPSIAADDDSQLQLLHEFKIQIG